MSNFWGAYHYWAVFSFLSFFGCPQKKAFLYKKKKLPFWVYKMHKILIKKYTFCIEGKCKKMGCLKRDSPGRYCSYFLEYDYCSTTKTIVLIIAL